LSGAKVRASSTRARLGHGSLPNFLGGIGVCRDPSCLCRANMAHRRQSRPDSCLRNLALAFR
jgi:hypothetical protein